MSILPAAMSSVTAGPAPLWNSQSTAMPSALNSASSSPFACAEPITWLPTNGTPPVPMLEMPKRMTAGLPGSAAAAEPDKPAVMTQMTTRVRNRSTGPRALITAPRRRGGSPR